MSLKSQFYFEIVSILVGEQNEETDTARVGFHDVFLPSGVDREYFFRKIVIENTEDFEVLDIHAMISSALSGAYNSVSKKLVEKLSPVISTDNMDRLFHLPSKIDDMLIRRSFLDTPPIVYLHKKSPTFIIPSPGNTFCVISNDSKNVTSLIRSLKSKSEELAIITKDFGLPLQKFLAGKDYQAFLLTNMEKIAKFESGNPKNNLEKEVIDVCSKVTSSFLSNVTVHFKEPNESFEYDFFINLPRNKLIVEPTDYESIKEEISGQRLATETLKSKIILAMQDKAQRLNAKSIVVVNGFPEDTFSQLKIIADSRGVILMNENDYKQKLPDELCYAMLSSFSRPRIQRFARLNQVYE